MSAIAFDLRAAWRSIRRRPAWSLAVVALLAVGSGLLTAVAGVVASVLVHPLPYPQPDRIVALTTDRPREGLLDGRVSLPDLEDWRRQCPALTEMAAVDEDSFVVRRAATPERVAGARVTPGFFEVLGVKPLVGQPPSADRSPRGARRVYLAEPFWKRHFGRDPAVLGQALGLDDRVYTVAGVMPSGVDFPRHGELWTLDGEEVGGDARAGRFLTALGRLRAGPDLAAANAQLAAVSQRLATAYPDTNAGYVARATPLSVELYGSLRPGLLLLLAAAALVYVVLLIDAAELVLARGIAGLDDLSLRLALGASRLQIGRLVVLESVLLAAAGGTLGALLGLALTRLFERLRPSELDLSDALRLGGRGALFCLGVAVVSGAVISVPTLVQAARRSPAAGLQSGTARSTSRWTGRFEAALIFTQVALTLAVLDSAGVMAASVARLLAVDPGFRAGHVLTARLELPDFRYPKPAQQEAFFRAVIENLQGRPGILSVGGVTNLPLGGSDMLFTATLLAGETADVRLAEHPRVHYRAATEGYFRTLGVPLLAGHVFGPSERSASHPAFLVNEAFVEGVLHGKPALGRRLVLPLEGLPPGEIVGVVGDIRHRGVASRADPEVYSAYDQRPWPFMTLAVKTAGDPTGAIPLVKAAVAAVDREQPVDEIRPMAAVVASSLSRQRALGALLGLFGLAALGAAAAGTLGVAAQAVRLRLREIAVQLALGATPTRLCRVFVAKRLVLACGGLVVGSLLSMSWGRLFAGLLYGITPEDPLALAAAWAVLLLAVGLAAWLPARRAVRLDPAESLRHE